MRKSRLNFSSAAFRFHLLGRKRGQDRGVRGPSSKRRLLLERLEERLCFAVFYDFDVVAATGSNGLTDIEPAVSINDSGKVAFVASQALGQSVFVADDDNAPISLSFATPSTDRTYGRELQINNANQVAAVDRTVQGTVGTRSRIWDANNPGTFEIISRGTSPNPLSGHFDALGTFTSISNDRRVVLAGLDTPASTWELHQSNTLVEAGDFFSEITTFPTGTFFRFAAADDERTVVGSRQGTQKQIVLYDISGLFDTLDAVATTGTLWNDLGVRPGISDDGKIVAFYGDLTTSGASALGLSPGPGIFTAIDHDDNLFTDVVITRVAGIVGNGILDENETYADVNENGVFDAGVDTEQGVTAFDVDGRVGVARSVDVQAAGKVIHTAWVGTDSDTLSRAIHASNLKIKTSGTSIVSVDKINAGRVVGVGETVDGFGAITDLAIHDAVNGSGQIAFWATTGGSDAIVLANPGPPEVVVVTTHGFGNTWNSPIGHFEVFSNFLDDWYALGNKFETLPEIGSPIYDDVASYVSNWNSSDGWIDAILSVTASIALSAQGQPLAAAAARAVAVSQMKRASQIAEAAALKILTDLESTGLLGDPNLSQNGEQFIQLVGHSRGAAVNAELARLLSGKGYLIEEYISLDGYSTDWPGISSILGDIDIEGTISPLTSASKVKDATNFRVQDGLAEVIFDALAGPAMAVASHAGLAVQILTPFVLGAIRNALPDWKAPDRIGFDSNEVMQGSTDRTNHLNIVDVYLENPQGLERYILESYVGRNRSGPSPVTSSGETSEIDEDTTALALLRTPGFTDGNFSLSEAIQQSIVNANLSSNTEPFIQAWAHLVTGSNYILGTYWQPSGPVQLVSPGGNPAVQISEADSSSITQDIGLPSNALSIDFDLSVANAEAGERLAVLFDGLEIGGVDLTSAIANGNHSISLPQLQSDAGEVSFVLLGTGAASTNIVLDNIELVTDEATTPGDFDQDGDVDGRDFLVWQRNPSVGSLSVWQEEYGQEGTGVGGQGTGEIAEFGTHRVPGIAELGSRLRGNDEEELSVASGELQVEEAPHLTSPQSTGERDRTLDSRPRLREGQALRGNDGEDPGNAFSGFWLIEDEDAAAAWETDSRAHHSEVCELQFVEEVDRVMETISTAPTPLCRNWGEMVVRRNFVKPQFIALD